MLEIKNLTVNYGAICALRGISLEVKQGDIVTLIGNLLGLLIPPCSRWNQGHTRSSIEQVVSCWDRGPFHK